MSKDEPSGFLGRMAQLARGVTSNDTARRSVGGMTPAEGQALKEMIERKRRNDAVRKREFDQLRKLRRRDSSGMQMAAQAKAGGFFRSSWASHVDERQVTLKKINEIEAQMSMQWWRGKPGSVTERGELTPTSEKVTLSGHLPVHSPKPPAQRSYPPSQSVHSADAGGGAKATDHSTQPISEVQVKVSTEFDAVQSASAQTSSLAVPSSDTLQRSGELYKQPGKTTQFSALSGFFAPHLAPEGANALTNSSVLDSAAIHFANGHVEEAENELLRLLTQTPGANPTEEQWMVLLDLYRATGQQEKFENAAIDFAARFGRSAPAWIHYRAASEGEHSAQATSTGYRWVAPSVLDCVSARALQAALPSAAPPWVLDWSALTEVHEDAVSALTQIFQYVADELVQIVVAHERVLDAVLMQKTVQGDRDVGAGWWLLRMAWLRMVDRAQEFETVALDYCITYEISPPAWVEPCCDCQQKAEQGAGVVLPAWMDSQLHSADDPLLPVLNVPTYPAEVEHSATMNLSGAQPGGQRSSKAIMTELSGQVLSQLPPDLPTYQEGQNPVPILVVMCDQLERVDFSGAGALLSWAAQWKQHATLVQFHNLHRLLVIFFNIMGVNEYAHVLARKD